MSSDRSSAATASRRPATGSEGVGIAIRGLGQAYETRRGRVQVIDDLSLDIAPGTFVSLIGPSGCGKSTLLRAVAGLMKPTSGTIEVGGERVEGPHPALGMAFQDAVLLDWRTVLENVLLQADVRRMPRRDLEPRARGLLASVGLGDLVDRHPFELSGGQRQRVAVCRALVHHPEILMMDEPFGALDALTRETVSEDLQTLWTERRMTTLFVTHSISEAVFLSDRVVVMSTEAGNVAADIEIDIPRPRRFAELPTVAAYTDAVAHIRGLLHAAHQPARTPTTVDGEPR